MLRYVGSSPPRISQRTRVGKLAVNQPESSKLWPPPPPPPPREGFDLAGADRGAGDGEETAGDLCALGVLRTDEEDLGVELAAAGLADAARAAAAAAAARVRALLMARRRRTVRSAARSKDSARTRSELPTSFVARGLLTLGVLDSVWTKSLKPKWMMNASTIPTSRKTISLDSSRIVPRDGLAAGGATRLSSGSGRETSGSSRAGCGSTGAGNERSCGLVAKT
jgi:hypothetical protein